MKKQKKKKKLNGIKADVMGSKFGIDKNNLTWTEWHTRFEKALHSMKTYFSLKEVEQMLEDRKSGRTKCQIYFP